MMSSRWAWISVILWSARVAVAQQGGVVIDAEGVLRFDTKESGRGKVVVPTLSSALARQTELRHVSLRSVADRAGRDLAEGRPIADELQHLAGLHSVHYVRIDVDGRDIWLIGPAEGWKILPGGRSVGQTSGQAVLRLEDLATAMRAVYGGTAEITCSIDPTREGLAAVQQIDFRPAGGRKISTASQREYKSALGRQKIRTGGVPAGSRFAHVMVEADYLMKRIAIGELKVRGVSNHLDAVLERSRRGEFQHTLARWWFTADEIPLVSNSDGTLFRFDGVRLELLNEEMLMSADGRRRGKGDASQRDRFSQEFTDQLASLQTRFPAFSDLRNLYDLVTACALAQRVGVLEDFKDTMLLDESRWVVPSSPPATEAEPFATVASAKGKNSEGRPGMVTSVAYGGVSMRIASLIGSASAGGSFKSDATGARVDPALAVPTRVPNADADWWSDSPRVESDGIEDGPSLEEVSRP